MNDLLERVRAVAKATGTKDDSQTIVPEGETVDEFTHLKREINLHIRELRNAIKERDTFAGSRAAREDKAEIVRQSTQIRTRLTDIRAEAQRLREMVMKEQRRLESKGKPTNVLDNRFKMCDLVEAHIEECDRWFKGLSFASVKDDPAKRMLLKGSQFTQPAPIQANFVPKDSTETELEQIDGIDEWRIQIQESEQVIDQRLDEIVQQTAAVRNLAVMIGHEYKALGIMIDEVESQMDKTQDNLDTTNAQLEKTKKKLASKKNCCIDIFLFLIIIAIVGYLIWSHT
jgi:predicted  nucleic acid-binding Zn-ribbon protein